MNKKLDRQLQKAIARVRQLKAQSQKLTTAKKKIKKDNRPGGRPRIGEDTLTKIKIEALTKPLRDVAFKYNVALATLYRHGITRKALDKMIEENAA